VSGIKMTPTPRVELPREAWREYGINVLQTLAVLLQLAIALVVLPVLFARAVLTGLATLLVLLETSACALTQGRPVALFLGRLLSEDIHARTTNSTGVSP
jgi:hypothetical protein